MKNLAHFVFGILGNISAMLLFLAPVVTFKRILKERSTEEFSGITYLMTLLNCLLSMWYGLPFVSSNNLLLSTINGAGAAIESIYVLIFLIFAPKKDKRKILLLLLCVLTLFGAVVLISLFALHGHTRKLFCGLINTIFAIIMFASPLTIIRLVIKTKSVEYMPFFLSLSVFLCGTLWLVFGLIGGDPFVAVQNGFGCGLGIVQLSLYAFYHKNKGTPKKGTADDGSTKVGKMNGKVADEEKQTSNHPIPDEQV